ncbi:MAG TPA: hypothetical protein P5228_12600, partial [Bacteroidales bacterium]|nr:hypothetical protein [Bacteroidales bacterium]
NDKFTFSGTWVYGTGNAINLPTAEYPVIPHNAEMSEWLNWTREIPSYGAKNSQRMEPYHRMDLSARYTKKLPKYERTIEFSVFNLYNRKNPYFYFLDQDYDPNTGQWMNVVKKISIFPVIPSISLNFKF